MSVAETVSLVPTAGPVENSVEVAPLSVPITAFPSSYDVSYQWAIGLIVAGMLKRAKYSQYAMPFVTTMMQLKNAYRLYKYKNNLRGANAWLAWYQKFEAPALRRLGRPVK